MADIKTRKVNNGFIRSMDKSIGASHRIRNAASDIKNMASRSSESDETDNATSFINPIKTKTVAAASSAVRRPRRRSFNTVKNRTRKRNNNNSKAQPVAVSSQRQRNFWKSIKLGETRVMGEASIRGVYRSIKQILSNTKLLIASLFAGGWFAVVAIMVTVFVAGCFHLADGLSVDGGLDGLSKEDRAYAELFLKEYPNGLEVPEGCTDIVKVAQSQVGNVGGRKYWSWYGFNNRVEWCACFVSWCGNQCGYIADGKMPKFAGVGVGVDWFKSHKQWKSRNYLPKPGNIIFFDWIPYGNIDHVGIVKACDGKTVYTIEGNSHDVCKERSYRVGDRCIYGYGFINVL